MTHAHYYKCLNWHHDNIEKIREHFVLTETDKPCFSRDRWDLGYTTAEVLFLPLGYPYEELEGFKNLRYVVSNTTTERHLRHISSSVKRITLRRDPFLENITSTPEHTLGLILSAHRRIPAASYVVQTTGTWDRYRWAVPKMLSQMRLGILGAGRVGRALSHMAAPLFGSVTIYEPFETGGYMRLKKDWRNKLLKWTSAIDVLSIHLALSEETEGMVDRDVLLSLREDAIVVNTAQGDILDVKALLSLLKRGDLWAAALDVFPGEFDPGFPTPLFQEACSYTYHNKNLILTPHIAGSTVDAWKATQARVIEKLLWEYEA